MMMNQSSAISKYKVQSTKHQARFFLEFYSQKHQFDSPRTLDYPSLKQVLPSQNNVQMGNSPHLIGMHASGQRLQAALVDSSGQVIERRETEISPENMIEQAASVARDLAISGGVSALGFAIPGLVNRQTDVVLVSRDLPST